MAQAEPIAMRDALAAEPIADGPTIPDSILPAAHHSASVRYIALGLAAAAGIGVAALISSSTGGLQINASGLVVMFCALAFAGGLLSTWSPCGYSTLSTLRIDTPQNLRAVSRWIPTFFLNALGYAVGGLILALALTAIGLLVPVEGFTPWTLAVIAAAALLYGLHQLDFIELPYPQLRLQVSHGARMNLPKWATGLLYGSHLGLNFATYVRTPILYVLVLACVLSGSLLTSIAIIMSLNLGRFLPLVVNLLPVPDWSIQRWMAEHDKAAITMDGSILVFTGSLLLAAVVTTVL